MSYPRPNRQSGFTLIELLVVMGILAVLLAVVLIAINPSKNFTDANNTQRRSDVSAVLNAIHSYMADPENKGQVPAGINATVKTITNDTAVTDSIDLCTVLVPTYIADLPLDPATGSEDPDGSVCTAASADYNTKYTVSAAGTRVTVTAPDTEGGITDISVTR